MAWSKRAQTSLTWLSTRCTTMVLKPSSKGGLGHHTASSISPPRSGMPMPARNRWGADATGCTSTQFQFQQPALTHLGKRTRRRLLKKWRQRRRKRLRHHCTSRDRPQSDTQMRMCRNSFCNVTAIVMAFAKAVQALCECYYWAGQAGILAGGSKLRAALGDRPTREVIGRLWPLGRVTCCAGRSATASHRNRPSRPDRETSCSVAWLTPTSLGQRQRWPKPWQLSSTTWTNCHCWHRVPKGLKRMGRLSSAWWSPGPLTFSPARTMTSSAQCWNAFSGLCRAWSTDTWRPTGRDISCTSCRSSCEPITPLITTPLACRRMEMVNWPDVEPVWEWLYPPMSKTRHQFIKGHWSKDIFRMSMRDTSPGPTL